MNMNLPKQNSRRNAPKRALIIFTSHPDKEALRKNLGGTRDQCRDIYLGFLRHVLGNAIAAQKQAGFDIIVASEKADLPNIEKAYSPFPGAAPYSFLEHSGSHFDAKLKYALKTTFEKGYDQLVVIGNDCLDLTPEILCRAFENLNNNEVVLGPADDGGFYLLGLKEFKEILFKDIPWCTPAVFRRICQNIEELQKSLSLLPRLQDIDKYDDLKKWLYTKPGSQNRLLYNFLLSLFITQFTLIFCHRPFLSQSHLKKRIWQKPPPFPPQFLFQ